MAGAGQQWIRSSGALALAGTLLAACSEAPAAAPAEPVDIAALSLAIDGSQDVEVFEPLTEPMGPPIQAAIDFSGPNLVSLATTRTRDRSGAKSAPLEIKTDRDGRLVIGFPHLSLDELDDIQLEDLLDALLYPDEYEEEDRQFPEQIQGLDGKEVALTGFMIPVVWEETKVEEFMLVRDLLACCFGGAPQPDEWVSVLMPPGEGSEYHSFVPIVVRGTFHIAALEDEAGYAAGCYRMDGKTVLRQP